MLLLLRVLGREIVTTGYGMPSSHAQFVTFFAAFLVLFLLIRYLPNASVFGFII